MKLNDKIVLDYVSFSNLSPKLNNQNDYAMMNEERYFTFLISIQILEYVKPNTF